MAVIKYENEKQSKRHKLDEMIDFSSRRLSREAVYIEAINPLSRTTVKLNKFKL